MLCGLVEGVCREVDGGFDLFRDTSEFLHLGLLVFYECFHFLHEGVGECPGFVSLASVGWDCILQGNEEGFEDFSLEWDYGGCRGGEFKEHRRDGIEG